MRTDATRFEPGNPLLWGAVGGAASLRVLLKLGIDAIHQRAMSLSQQLMDGLQEQGAQILGQVGQYRMSPIVTFKMPQTDMVSLFTHLNTNHVTGSYRAGGIRLSPHAYNSEEEIAHVLDLIRSHKN